MTNDVRAAIRERYGTALLACEDLAALDRDIRAAHPISAKGGGRLAVVFLHAKARKTFGAILLVAREGYGEDAMILARSLTNLCIDLAYLTAADTPERVRVWLASARIQLRRWATSLGRTLQADTVNWGEEEELAKKWLNLADRAARSDTQNFYNLAYRHGSIYEHSDAASFESFLAVTARGFIASSGPSDTMVSEVVTIASTAFADVVTRWAAFFKIDLGDARVRMENIVKTALASLPDTDKVPPVVLPGDELDGPAEG
ncbi:MAG: DUF5677 domain-containing protein [Candidatus Rokuibacteriota bacterium]